MPKSRNRVIEVTVDARKGTIPPYLVLAQRHYEKDPPPMPAGATTLTATVPVDLVRLILGNDSPYLATIEEVTVTYRRKG